MHASFSPLLAIEGLDFNHAMPIMLLVLACLAVAYRFYSAFLAAHVAALDDSRQTPAHQFYDGQNYHPTHKWVLFGHHFAAISGAGPLIGPVLAIQFGYLPGLVWIVVGVCLAGAVQDMLVLAASVRRGGRSLAEIARLEIGARAGAVGSITILFTVIIALAGLGVIVVKALGGEEIGLAPGTVFVFPEGKTWERSPPETGSHVEIPAGTTIRYSNGSTSQRSESFTVVSKEPFVGAQENGRTTITLPQGVTQVVVGSAWGTFTIACTIPIALFTGLYMYRIRKGHVVEASLIGAAATLFATFAGNWVHNSTSLAPWFELSRNATIIAICTYGFVASVLPVWLLLCPRDYLSSFLKIGTIALLVGGILIANPKLEAPAVNQFFQSGGGPYFNGPIFPFCFICIMCGAISGFHALVSSGTTPKMVSQESHVRLIGYGAMLIEGLVGVVALLAAASLPQGDYWAINIPLKRSAEYAETLEKMGANKDELALLEEQVGGESLRGRTGGAVTLAVGMSQVMTDATHRVVGNGVDLGGMIQYWYHFAIMFEALFILTTIDTGTRIARFLLQEALGKIYRPFERTDWVPGAVISTALVTLGWGGLIWTGSIDTIWPMFGIANQMLAVVALAVVTTVMVNSGRARYAWLTVLPMLFVIASTTTAGVMMIQGTFWPGLMKAVTDKDTANIVKWALNSGFVVIILVCVLWIVCEAVAKWIIVLRTPAALQDVPKSSR